MSNTIPELIAILNQHKQDLLERVVQSPDITVYEKFSFIRENNLWETSQWIQHPFKALCDVAMQQLQRDYPCPQYRVNADTTDLHDPDCNPRYSTVWFDEIIESLQETVAYAKEVDNLDTCQHPLYAVRVYEGYNKPPIKEVIHEVPTQEYIDLIWEYAVKHKMIGYVVDW